MQRSKTLLILLIVSFHCKIVILPGLEICPARSGCKSHGKISKTRPGVQVCRFIKARKFQNSLVESHQKLYTQNGMYHSFEKRSGGIAVMLGDRMKESVI